MQNISKFLFLIFLTSTALAQSVGGGLGGDRPGMMLREARPTVIEPKNMSCNEVQDFIIKNGKARINKSYKKVAGYQVVFSRYTISCGDTRDVTPVSVPTEDLERCYVGFMCADGFR